MEEYQMGEVKPFVAGGRRDGLGRGFLNFKKPFTISNRPALVPLRPSPLSPSLSLYIALYHRIVVATGGKSVVIVVVEIEWQSHRLRRPFLPPSAAVFPLQTPRPSHMFGVAPSCLRTLFGSSSIPYPIASFTVCKWYHVLISKINAW